MSPAEELKALVRRKEELRSRIASRRAQWAADAAALARPVALVDRGVALWQSIPGGVKTAAVPVGLFVARQLGKRAGGPLRLLKYAPLVMGVAQSVMRSRGTRAL